MTQAANSPYQYPVIRPKKNNARRFLLLALALGVLLITASWFLAPQPPSYANSRAGSFGIKPPGQKEPHSMELFGYTRLKPNQNTVPNDKAIGADANDKAIGADANDKAVGADANDKAIGADANDKASNLTPNLRGGDRDELD